MRQSLKKDSYLDREWTASAKVSIWPYTVHVSLYTMKPPLTQQQSSEFNVQAKNRTTIPGQSLIWTDISTLRRPPYSLNPLSIEHMHRNLHVCVRLRIRLLFVAVIFETFWDSDEWNSEAKLPHQLYVKYNFLIRTDGMLARWWRTHYCNSQNLMSLSLAVFKLSFSLWPWSFLHKNAQVKNWIGLINF